MNIKKIINYRKFVSIITAISLLISVVVGPTAASAINNNQITIEYNQIFKEFILPYSYGKITKSHFAGTDRVIINIQDLHCHPKVQKNIANIIETFDKNFGVNKIYLEGAYGDVSTSWINDKSILEKMLDTGRLTGAEYYSALSGKTDLIKGLEEKEPYLDNINRLGQILQNQDKIELILQSLRESTEQLKKKYYTKRQYKLENIFKQYKEGKITSQKYYAELSKHIDKLGIDLTEYENTLIYITLLELQKDLKYNQIAKELQSFILSLKKQVPYTMYKSLLENTENFKEIEKLYSYIIQLDKSLNLNISSNFKELDKYFRCVELSKKINPVELVKEDEFLIQEINTRFAQTKAKQEIVFLIYFEKYLTDYLTTKITLDNYKYYKNNIERYKQVYNKYVDNRILSLLDKYLAETDKFYAINLDRNNYFTKNIFKENYLLNKIENPKQAKDDINQIIDNMNQVKKLDIVVTGGFHSQTVTDLLENKNVSYIVITPNVTEGIKLAEDTYYELAKEQSKISFQTIAPVIASLSPQLQKTILKKINGTKEQIETLTNLNDAERAELVSKLFAAKLLESDDLGEVETQIQNVIKSIVDDVHKEKVTPELISKIKNLQEIIKDKKELENAIDLLEETTTKQSVTLLRDMFVQFYNSLDSFIVSANGKLFQQGRYSAKYTDEETSMAGFARTSKLYYDEAKNHDKETNNNIYDFFFNSDKNRLEIIEKLKTILGDNLDIKQESFIVNISKHPYYPVDLIKFTVTDKSTQKDYKISIENFGNSGYIEFSINIEGDSDRKKLVPFTDKLAQNIMEGNFNIETEQEIKSKQTEGIRKVYYDETERKNTAINNNIHEFFSDVQTKKADIAAKIKNILDDGLEIKVESFISEKKEKAFYPMETIKIVITDKNIQQEYKISVITFYDSDDMIFGIDFQNDSDGNNFSLLVDKLARHIMEGNFNIKTGEEIKVEQIETIRKEYYDETKKKDRQISNNIYEFFNYAQAKGLGVTSVIKTILGEGISLKQGSFSTDISNHPYYPVETITFTVTDKTTQKEYNISVIKFSNLEDMLFSIEIEGDSDRERIVPVVDRLAREIMKGTFKFGIFEKLNQLKLLSTQRYLNRIGNWGIIKKIYKGRSGTNFQFTRLGVAIGATIESFSFWSPKFVAKHNFSVEDETGLQDAVRGIRGAAIAVSLIPVTLSLINPLSILFVIPVAILTENILHYIYNTRNSKINVNFDREDNNIAVLVERDNNIYSLIFNPMYRSIFLGSVNEDAFSEENSKYTTPESIEKLLGIKIKISKKKLSVKSNDIRTKIKFIKFDTVSETAKSLVTEKLPAVNQKDINLLMKDSNCSDVKYVYLSDTDVENQIKIKDAVDNHKLIVLYPFSKTCDVEKLSDEELFSLYLQISTSFFRMLSILPEYPRLRKEDFIGMEYLLAELIKNAFVHGNLADPSKPIYVYCTKDGFTVYNSYKAQPTNQKRLNFSAMSALSGAHKGLSLIQEYVNEGHIQVTPAEERIRQIGDDKNDRFYAVTIKLADEKEKLGIQDVSKYLKFNDFSISEYNFKEIVKYLQDRNFEINDTTFKYIQYFLYLLHTQDSVVESYHDNIIYKIFDLNNNYRKIIYDYCKENEEQLKGNPYFVEKIVDFVLTEKCTTQELKELLNLIYELKTEFFSEEKTPRYGYFRRRVENYNISKDFLEYYLDNKDSFKSKDYKALMAYLIFSEGMNLEECLNYVSFNDNLKELLKELVDRHIYALNVSYSGLALKLFFNPVFNIILKQKYEQRGETLTTLLRYRTAIKIAHSLYMQLGEKVKFINEDIIDDIVGICVQDIENKRDLLSMKILISPESYFHGIDRIKAEFTENFEFRVRRDKVSDTGLFVINNNETSSEGEKLFSNDGLKTVFGILGTEPRVNMNLEVTDENDVKEKIEKQLQAIINYPVMKQKYGLSNAIFAFNGHGISDTICFIGKDGKEDSCITVTDVSEALLQAYKNGANLEEITLDLTSCFSYYFAENVIKKLEELEKEENLEIKFPQILASAGQETRVGHFVSFTDNQTQEIAFFTDNMTSSLIEYLQEKHQSGQKDDFLSFDDIFNAEIEASDHTIFVSGQDVEELNADFRTSLFELLGNEFIEDEEIKKTIKITQLQLPSTQEILDKIGNNKIIQKLYKEKSGDKFKYTKLGAAIGALLELFSLWGPNFVKKHNFDPSVQAKMTAVVWVIRALSIGLGLGAGVGFAIFLGPIAFLMGIPVLFLTEIVVHFAWNITHPDKMLQIGSKNDNYEYVDTDLPENKLTKEEIDEIRNNLIDKNIDLQKMNRFLSVIEQIDFNELLLDFEKELPIRNVIPKVIKVKFVSYMSGNLLKQKEFDAIFDFLTADADADKENIHNNIKRINDNDVKQIIARLGAYTQYKDVNYELADSDFKLELKNLIHIYEGHAIGFNKRNENERDILVGNEKEWDFAITSNKLKNLFSAMKDNKNKKIQTLQLQNKDALGNTLFKDIYQTEDGVFAVVFYYDENNKKSIKTIYQLSNELLEQSKNDNENQENGNINGIELDNGKYLRKINDNEYIIWLQKQNEETNETEQNKTISTDTRHKISDYASYNTAKQKWELKKDTREIDGEEIDTIIGNILVLRNNDGTFGYRFILKDGTISSKVKGDCEVRGEEYVFIKYFGVEIRVSIRNNVRVEDEYAVYIPYGKNKGKQDIIILQTKQDIKPNLLGRILQIIETYLFGYSNNLKKVFVPESNKKFGHSEQKINLEIDSANNIKMSEQNETSVLNHYKDKFYGLDFEKFILKMNDERYKGDFLSIAKNGMYIDEYVVYGKKTPVLFYVDEKNHNCMIVLDQSFANKFMYDKIQGNITDFAIDLTKEMKENTFALFFGKILPKGAFELLQTDSTQEILDKIGNNKIIQKLYEEKSGDKFKYTKLGVAIGVLLELFSLWGPNFVKKHNFDPSVQAKMTAVVWVIRALSIGLGLGAGVGFAIFLGPIAFLMGIPVLFLTEIVVHFVWNISKVPPITDLKESIRPIDVEEEVEKTGLAQDFIGMVNRLSADKGFISVYDAYKQGRKKNKVRRELIGDEHITKNNGYALGISTYYLGDGKLFEAIPAIADSKTGINVCTYNNGYYEFQQDGTRIRTNDQYLEKIFEDCIENNKEIYFFLPPNIYTFSSADMRKAQIEYMDRNPVLKQTLSGLGDYQPGITKSEVEWIKNHPQYMKYVHFVVGAYTFLDENMRTKIFRRYFNVNNNSKTVASLLSNTKAYMKTDYNLSLKNKKVEAKDKTVEAKIDYGEDAGRIVLLIGKQDGTRYSVKFSRKAGVFLNSINDSLCHFPDKNIEDIGKMVGAKINVNLYGNNIVAKSNEPGTTLSFVNDEFDSVFKISSSLKKNPLIISQQQLQEMESLMKDSGSQEKEYVYLDAPFQENKIKIKDAIDNDKLIVLYPFSSTYNIDLLTDKELYALYRTIGENIFIMVISLFPKDMPKLTQSEVRMMKYVLQEFVKNAFVHGNISDTSKPIYIKCSNEGVRIYNSVVEDSSIDEKVKARRKSLATAARLTGEHKGLQKIQDYEKEGFLEVTPEYEREKIIDGNKYYSVSALIISKKQRERTANDLMVIRDIASSVFALQKGIYSPQEYKEVISKIISEHQGFAVENEIFVHNIIDFVSESLDEVFFVRPLINQIFGTKDISTVFGNKKLLITKTKQQENNLKQILKNNNIEDTEIVTMEIKKNSVTDIRSDMYIDVQKGIRAKYDSKENKIVVYSKKGINISDEEIEQLIMQAYFDERNEDIIDNDIIAFANETDKTLADTVNRLKTAYTDSVTMPNKETKFNLSLKNISNFTTVCKQEFVSTGIKTFVVSREQAEKFADEIKSLQEQDFKFIVSCKADTVTDITKFDGLVIDAPSINNINQAIKFMETIKKTVFKQGVAKQITIKFSDELYKEFSGTDIFNNYGIIPVINADNISVVNIGKYEVENVTENNIDNLLRSNDVIGLVIDNARVFAGKRSILKEIFSKEHKYNKGYNASLSSKFDYVCYDVTKIADLLNVDINNEEDLNKLKNINLLSLNLSSDSLTYLEYLNKKGNYEEMAGFIRGIAMNSARAQIMKGLKEKEIELDVEKFAKEANGKYQKAFLTVAVQLMMEGVDITTLLETDFIDSDMTTKQYLDSVYEKVNVNIEDILKNNEYKLHQTQNAEKTIEEFKNFVILLDNLKVVKEATAEFEMSMKAVKDILSAA